MSTCINERHLIHVYTRKRAHFCFICSVSSVSDFWKLDGKRETLCSSTMLLVEHELRKFWKHPYASLLSGPGSGTPCSLPQQLVNVTAVVKIKEMACCFFITSLSGLFCYAFPRLPSLLFFFSISRRALWKFFRDTSLGLMSQCKPLSHFSLSLLLSLTTLFGLSRYSLQSRDLSVSIL